MVQEVLRPGKRRVVVTGMGIICSLGVGIDEFWKNCLGNKPTVAYIPASWRRYHSFYSTIWSPLPKIDFSRFGILGPECIRLDTSTQLAMGSATMAIDNAGIEKEAADKNTMRLKGIKPDRAGVVFGSGVGGITSFFSSHANHLLMRPKSALGALLARAAAQKSGKPVLDEVADICTGMEVPKRYNPFVVSMGMPNAAAGNISLKFGLTGPSNTLCSACASGTVALGHAYRCIKSGLVDFALAGGTEYLADQSGSIFRGFDVVKTLARENGDPRRACRPFDRKRSGFLFSEGAAAALILEELGHAVCRGASIIGEIVGFAETCDASNIMCMAVNSAPMQKVIMDALGEAALSPDDIHYINAHGTGTAVNDDAEAAVINAVFGKRPMVNTTKSIMGHSIGASGAIEAIVTLLSIKNHVTHVCNNLEEPTADLNFTTEVKEHEIRYALSQSFAFGGHNAVLVFREFPDP